MQRNRLGRVNLCQTGSPDGKDFPRKDRAILKEWLSINRLGLHESKRRLTGYAALYGEKNILAPGLVEVFEPGCFDVNQQRDILALFNSHHDQLLGRRSNGTLILDAKGPGLRYDILFNPKDRDHYRIRAKIRRGDVSTSSILYRVLSDQKHVQAGTVTFRITAAEIFAVGPSVWQRVQGSRTNKRYIQHRLKQAKPARDEQYAMLQLASLGI